MRNLIPGVSISKLSGLPGPIQGILAVLAGGSIMTAAYFIVGGNTKAMLIIVCGMVAVLLLLALYRAILGWSAKRKSNPLSQGIAGNAAAAPQKISEPARRARLDDLRRNFDSGVEKFRAAGKNLYSVPWYVLVGEPGSGKTEAIRHCNVGFPPGLQDQLQGAGGTLNMNWWFTNQAIILDTAGRLMFEEVVPGSTNEWNEFLKLLKVNRPNCPINGMLLVIPVDTLIKDSADSIEKKAGKIAQQFDQIQRILGVRFPVFIIITKCDLLNGFREFFDDLNDPQLQHQIMGWSNPAPLDQKFDPKAVTDHMENVKKRLTDRRQQLLLDPVNTEDAQGRRVDQVDALYALPDSLTKIAPRLRRYLEMVFVAGEWSPKPLFLRGIYFTSSMTEGSALDAELAEVLGVPVDSLPEGRVWRRDRAYFLRDLFIEKVFREKGLVTRADNADKQQRTRRAIVMTVGFLAVIVVGALTWLGHMQLDSHIGKDKRFWGDAAQLEPTMMQIVGKNTAYNDQKNIPVDGKKLSLAELFYTHLDFMKHPIEIPIIFRPMALISGDLNKDRAKAYRELYESTILSPVYAASRAKLDTLNGSTWNNDASLTLAQLMKLEYADSQKDKKDVGKRTLASEVHPQVELDPMLRFVLTPEDYNKAKNDLSPPAPKDSENIQAAADWVYSEENAAEWPPKILEADAPRSRKVVSEGVTHAIEFWTAQARETSPKMANILAMKQALGDFKAAEDKLLALKTGTVQKVDPYTTYVADWQAAYSDLQKAKSKANTAWAALVSGGASDSSTLRSLYSSALDQIAGEAKGAYDKLLALTPADIDAAKANASDQSLFADRQAILKAKSDLAEWQAGDSAKKILADIGTLDDSYLTSIKGVDGAFHHRFEVQAQIYEIADKALPRPGAAADTQAAPLPLARALEKVDADLTAANDQIGKGTIAAIDGDRLFKAGDLARFTADAGARYRRFVLTNAAVIAMPDAADKWPAYIATQLAPNFPPEHMVRPKVPVAVADEKFQAKYSPDAVGSATDAMNAIDKLVADAASGKILDVGVVSARSAAVRKALDAYLADYRKYWQKGVFDELHFQSPDWKTFNTSLANVTEPLVRDSLMRYSDKAVNALTLVNDTAGVTQLNNERAVGDRQPFQDQCAEVLRTWKAFGDDPRQARSTILPMDALKFPDRYSVGIAKASPDSFVARYWVGLPLEGLRVLANDCQKDIIAGLKELAKYQRFPLAPPGDPKKDLTANEIPLARAALEKVRGASSGAMAAGSASIGQGGSTKDKSLDDALGQLRGDNLLSSMQQYLTNLEKFFAVLPQNNQPMSVTMSVDKERLKAANAVSIPYAYMDISQNAKMLKQAYLQGPNLDDVSLDYPGADVVFQYRDRKEGGVLQTDTITGPWAPFRLIKGDNVKVVKREGTKWTLEYTVTDPAKKTWLMWLVLDFKAELPELKDWPVPPANTPN